MKRTPTERLALLVRNCVASDTTRRALLLRTDRLPEVLARPHHLRLAEAALKPLLQLPRAEMFHLPGPRLAVAWRGDAEDALIDAVRALEHLLDQSTPSPIALPQILALYDLPEHADLLLDTLAEEAPGQALGQAPGQVPTASREPATPLDPALLTLLEASLAHADVSRFARRRAVWRVERSLVSLAWEERTLSVGELADGLVPGHDLMAEPWLFRRLSRTLERRILALLSSPGELTGAGPFAIDLNVAGLLSAEFLRFDGNLPPGLRGRVMLGLPPTDAIADARAWSFAVAFARARDYRLMLRDATPALLQVLAPVVPEFDYLLVPWSTQLPAQAGGLLTRCTLEQLVLTGCDTDAALAWGKDTGIALFRGEAASRDARRREGRQALGERAVAA